MCERIRAATGSHVPNESEVMKSNRKEELKKDFFRFCKYYFQDYITADFGWFHKKAAKEVLADPNCFLIAEWAREHAKSVFFDIFLPMFLYARGELTGMVIASANETKARILLGDIRSQIDANMLWINDYGELAAPGEWRGEYFATTDNVGFWAFGRGQSPRGVRKAAKRPNYCVWDDLDDKVIVKNEARVREAVDWLLEDLYGALAIKGSRMIGAGNRIHSKGILAHMVGDIEPEDPKREGIVHIKVFALENPRTHKKDYDGTPAWKENYSREILLNRMKKMGYRASRREYFHEHIEDGIVFSNDWIHWAKVPAVNQFDEIIIYADPSFKNTKASDYKAIVALGKKGRNFYTIKSWVKKTSINAMVNAFYDFYDQFGTYARYYIEANMLQDLLFDDEFTAVGEERGYQLPIRLDKRKKPDKYTRIENMTPFYERDHMWFNEKERKNPNMQTLIQQILSFPTGNDDGPDAQEGALSLLQAGSRGAKFAPRSGKFQKNTSRR